MAGPAALLASVSHQLGGLRSLRLLQESHGPPHRPAAPALPSGGSPSTQREAPRVEAARGQPARPGTLRERAAGSRLARVAAAAARLVEAEQTLLLRLPAQRPLPVRLKDSIEFRNICIHMALQKEGLQFDRDLCEAHQCLKTIIEKLICSLAAFPSESYIPVRAALRQILQNLLTI